jgi:hypothetical protein
VSSGCAHAPSAIGHCPLVPEPHRRDALRKSHTDDAPRSGGGPQWRPNSPRVEPSLETDTPFWLNQAIRARCGVSSRGRSEFRRADAPANRPVAPTHHSTVGWNEVPVCPAPDVGHNAIEWHAPVPHYGPTHPNSIPASTVLLKRLTVFVDSNRDLARYSRFRRHAPVALPAFAIHTASTRLESAAAGPE